VSSDINLVPGQYQLGDLVWGRHTPYAVKTCEPQSYNVVPQDFAAVRSDTIEMGQDTLQASPVIFEINVADYALIPTMSTFGGEGVAATIPDGAHTLRKLAKEWRADEVRSNWNELKPLRVCERDGTVLTWFGRPRKFQASKRTRKSSHFVVNAEYMRTDTLQYGIEYKETLSVAFPTAFVIRTEGDCESPIRVLVYGPILNPTITIGDLILEMDYDVEAGQVMEITSYSWLGRRCVATTPGGLISVASRYIGEYLDKVGVPPYAITPIEFSAGGTNADTRVVVCWRDAYSVMA
jgi:hypothetical protein